MGVEANGGPGMFISLPWEGASEVKFADQWLETSLPARG